MLKRIWQSISVTNLTKWVMLGPNVFFFCPLTSAKADNCCYKITINEKLSLFTNRAKVTKIWLLKNVLLCWQPCSVSQHHWRVRRHLSTLHTYVLEYIYEKSKVTNSTVSLRADETGSQIPALQLSPLFLHEGFHATLLKVYIRTQGPVKPSQKPWQNLSPQKLHGSQCGNKTVF